MRPEPTRFRARPLATACSLIAATFVLLAPSAASADDKFELEKGFVRLDNGQDLGGWTGKPDGWSVVEGAIHLDARQAKGNIYSEVTHSGDCVIRLQFRANERADSGVFFHGKQLQVRDYPTAGPKQYAAAARPAGQWNELELDITSGLAVIKLNGQVIEKAWKIGGDTSRGVGLQKERGNFDFRYLRFREKQ